jgi:release factor glutamine methyltransferase
MFRLDLSHFSLGKDGREVYSPAEDTYTLIDALAADLDTIKSRKPLICAEIGSGSGAVLASLAHMLGPELVYIAVDINPKAAQMTQITLNRNEVVYGEVLRMDLTASLTCQIDLLVCNPPYVVTPQAEYLEGQKNRDIVAAYAGGEKGRMLTDRLIRGLPGCMRPGGLWYILLVQENCPSEVGTEIYRRRIRGETQIVVRGGY